MNGMNVRNVRNGRFGVVVRDTQYAGAHRSSVRDIGVIAYFLEAYAIRKCCARADHVCIQAMSCVMTMCYHKWAHTNGILYGDS